MEQLEFSVEEICDKIQHLIHENEKVELDITGKFYEKNLYLVKSKKQKPIMELNFFTYLETGFRDYTLMFERNWYNENRSDPLFQKFRNIFPVIENKQLGRIGFAISTSEFNGFDTEVFEFTLGIKFVNCIFEKDVSKVEMGRYNIYENCEFLND